MAKLKEIKHPLPVTSAEWKDKVLNAPVPVIVDFWADWCAPCHMIAPHLNRLAEEYAGRLLIYKLDVDANSDIAMQYNVHSIPTLLFLYKGEVKDTLIGAMPYPVLKRKVEEFLAQVPEPEPEVLETEV